MSAFASRLDIIVLGATGFTGRYVVKKMRSIKEESEYSDLTWGIAGRSKKKLNILLSELKDLGVNVNNIPIFECDVTNDVSIKDVCSQAKVIVNSTGPYTILSEPIVKACIQTRTHYVDISAELHHMLTIYRSYYKAAEEANVLIISACGYGSVPGVMGFVHLEKHFDGSLQNVECYTELDIPSRAYSLRSLLCGRDNCLVHYGTWDSLVYELKNFPEYFRMRKETFPDPFYEPEREEMKKSFFHRKNAKIWFPYPGPDNNIVDMTQRLLHEKKCFRALLRRHPKFFTAGLMSQEGPSEEIMADTKYSFTFTGNGTGNDKKPKTMALKVSGTHPYEATAIAFIFSAITILRDESLMPKGGVLTTGAAFYETHLVHRLNNHGINFEFL